MLALTVIGFAIGLVGTVVSILSASLQIWRSHQGFVHLFYGISLLAVCGIFGALFYGNQQELDALRAAREQRDKLSNGAASLLATLPGNGSESCRAIVLSATAFIDKWHSETPLAWEASNSGTLCTAA
jgi:hypothetical protein